MAEHEPIPGTTSLYKYDLLPDVEDENKIVIAKKARNAVGPHIFNPNRDKTGKLIGYQRIHMERQEFPKVLYRPPTAEEITERRENLPKELWMDPNENLINLTGVNQLKRNDWYERYMKRAIEVVVQTEEQFGALEGNWTETPDCLEKATAPAPKPAAPRKAAAGR